MTPAPRCMPQTPIVVGFLSIFLVNLKILSFLLWVLVYSVPTFLEDISEIHKTEPYVYCQMVSGKDAPIQGEGKNSWLTGTAAWTFTVLTQGILGIKPDYNGLLIDPCIPSSVSEYKVKRLFRNTMYHITIKNPNKSQKGVKKLIVDGKQIPVGVIPYSKKKQVNVEVIL